MTKTEPLSVIITGGTIDSSWDPAKDTAVVGGESAVPEYFTKLDIGAEIEFKVVFMKDSRELTPDDLKTICQAVDSSKHEKVLVTHGTYTMPDTARFLQANLKNKKAVILTGSMIPLKGYEMSDAPFNLGFALATLQNLDSGVRLAMNGQVFEPNEVAKNMAEARFFSIKQ